ncbi:hypothetical protein ACP275_07G099700 [Erythranthe tilingii]
MHDRRRFQWWKVSPSRSPRTPTPNFAVIGPSRYPKELESNPTSPFLLGSPLGHSIPYERRWIFGLKKKEKVGLWLLGLEGLKEKCTGTTRGELLGEPKGHVPDLRVRLRGGGLKLVDLEGTRGRDGDGGGAAEEHRPEVVARRRSRSGGAVVKFSCSVRLPRE